jgi:hypothetical protein
LNNLPRSWTVELTHEDGHFWAFSDAMETEMEAHGLSPEAALEGLQRVMEKAGWFLSRPFSTLTG